MGTALAIVVVLALLAKGGSQSQQGQGDGGKPPPTPEPNPVDDLIDTGKKIVGLVGGAGGGLGALLGTGGAAGGTAGGAGAAGGVGGSAGAGGAGGTGVVGGGGAGGTGAAGAGAAATVGSVEGAIGACGITLIVIIIIICNEIAKGQAEHKSFQSRILAFLPNARDLHSFERAVVERALGGSYANVQKWEEADFRLDRVVSGEMVRFRGFRQVMRWVPPPAGRQGADPLKLPRIARALAYAYLRERSRRGRALNANWQHMNVPLWADPDQDMAFRENMNKGAGDDPALGGLSSVPLITGRTVLPRTDKSDPRPQTGELLARPEDRNVDEEEAPLLDRKVARLLGLIDAIGVFRFDPTVYVAFDGREYRDQMMTRLGLTSSEATAQTRNDPGDTNPQRHGFLLSAEEFGVSVWVDAVRVKSGLWWGGARPALEVSK